MKMAVQRPAGNVAAPEARKSVNVWRNAVTCERDPIYLFACHLEWHYRGNLRAYLDLISALDDQDENIRLLAERLLHRSSPHLSGEFVARGWYE